MNDKKRADEAEEALRQICIDHLNFDPSDSEGTLPEEVVVLLNKELASLRVDKERLDWLESVAHKLYIETESTVFKNTMPIKVRTAIDAAREQTKTK